MNKLFTASLVGIILLLLMTFIEVSNEVAVIMAAGIMAFVFGLVGLRIMMKCGK